MEPDPSADATFGEPAERVTLSFIIRIWLEQPERGRAAAWRGHITQVPSGQRRSFDDLSWMAVFVLDHLERAGGRAPLLWRIRRRWLTWKRYRSASGG